MNMHKYVPGPNIIIAEHPNVSSDIHVHKCIIICFLSLIIQNFPISNTSKRNRKGTHRDQLVCPHVSVRLSAPYRPCVCSNSGSLSLPCITMKAAGYCELSFHIGPIKLL